MLGVREIKDNRIRHPHSSREDISKVAFSQCHYCCISLTPAKRKALAKSMRKLILVTNRPLGVTIMLCLVTSEDKFSVLIVSYHRRQ